LENEAEVRLLLQQRKLSPTEVRLGNEAEVRLLLQKRKLSPTEVTLGRFSLIIFIMNNH